MMPGSRPYEVENLVPFYFAAALRMLRRTAPRCRSPSRFRRSRRAHRSRGDRGRRPPAHVRPHAAGWSTEADAIILRREPDDVRIPVLRNALAAARSARLVLTIPGTKTIELAVLGKPAIAITPLNAPELVTINGPLTYLNRVPLVGVPLKRAVSGRRLAPLSAITRSRTWMQARR